MGLGTQGDEGVVVMKRRFEKALLFVMALAMLLSMLPVSAGAAMGRLYFSIFCRILRGRLS